MPYALFLVRDSIEILFCLFHGSVALFVLSCYLKSRSGFRTAFFEVFIVQSFIDCCSYVTVFLTARLTRFGFPTPEFLAGLPQSIIIVFLLGYFAYFEYLAHTVIAWNRFTVIRFPTQHKFIWSTGKRRMLWLLLCTFPAFAAFPRFYGAPKAIPTAEGGFALINTTPWVMAAANYISICICVCTTVISGFLELSTFVAYRSLPAEQVLKHSNDFRLLVYAMMQFIAQLFMTIFYITMLLAGKENPSVTQTAVAAYPYLNDLLTLSGSTCLLLTSAKVRSGYLQSFGISSPEVSTTRVVTVTQRIPQASCSEP